MTLGELATRIAAREIPSDVRVLKQSPIRTVVLYGDVVLKVLHRRAHKARREAHTLRSAHAREVPVPALVDHGEDWIATRFVPGRPAERRDLAALLRAIDAMHRRGMLHRDLHLDNVLISPSGPILLDTQKARFFYYLPHWLRRWELGYFAFSLGDPLPTELQHVRGWRDRRAHTHWRSRTARCTVESSGFTAVRVDAQQGFRRRALPEDALRDLLRAAETAPRLKDTARSALVRHGGYAVKRHRTASEATRSWRCGWGLEVRGVAVARALACVGPWLVMEDAGDTLIDWVEKRAAAAEPTALDELAEAMAQLLARLHRSGIYHADLKANNVCWRPGAPASLIDYGRVHFGRRVSSRRRAKNLAQLNAALPDVIPGPLRERALTRYLDVYAGDRPAHTAGDDLPARDELRREALRKRVIALSLARRHRWSGC